MNNLFSNLPADLSEEVFQTLLSHEQLKIERIVSKGHTSPPQDWYDQDEHEWVLVLQGAGELTFEDGRIERLSVGDYINIPAHCKHKVSWTDPEQETVWLAIFYR
ncbi:cupin domain-containing protein [Pseudoalteromonas sp. OOF1S-7]|uniref:cupin domain-containing protein n=1 Tax=Pseudoalteromonas sp. OOF1S-7 TaxID=2917757 RepID=UPI001EF5CF6D|nr:cupin domain-containing protein [Pseudoalteromonas sp. OOF1S-7]MCG7536659.1 cupin domain-containing protein [Pseudoalteromonas sp. OOF1S-7]